MSNVKGPDNAPHRNQEFEQLVEQYQTAVLRTCYLYLCDKSVAEDAVQETFIKVFRGMDSFKGESSEKTWIMEIAMHAVTWELTFDVLHPEWPIMYTEQDEPGIDEEPWKDEEYAAYDKQFVTAYQQKKILLNRSAMLSPFAAANPAYDISMEDEMAYVDWSEALLTQEAFKLTDKITFQFSTLPLPVKTAKAAVQFDLADGLHVELTELIVSVDHINFSFRITGDDPNKPLTMADWRHRAFAILADNATTQYLAASCGQREDGSLLYTGHCMISGETSRLTIIPVEESQENSVMRAGIVPDDLTESPIDIELK